MIVGYAVRRWQRSEAAEAACERWSHRCKIAVLAYLLPPVVVTALIRQPLTGTHVLTMGAIGALSLLSGALLGRLLISLWDMPPQRAGAFLGCAAMANIFSFGGLLVFSFWGNEGLQQLYLFELFKHVLYYGVFYPWCGTFGDGAARGRGGLMESLRAHPITLIPIVAVLIGLIVNFAIYREGVSVLSLPQWISSVNRVLVPVHVGILTFAVGLTLRPSRISGYWTECVASGVIAFIARPAVTAAIAYGCFSIGWIDSLGFSAAVLISAMPVAFNSLIPPTLYGLDQDLANSCWIFTTVVMIVLVPIMYVAVGAG